MSLYAFFKVNLIWAAGYLLILLFAELIPKRIIVEGIFALAMLGVSLLIVTSSLSAYAPLPISFLLISTGLPGVIVYAAVTLLFQGIKSVAEITVLSGGMVLLLVGLHAVKFIINRILWPVLLIPIIDLVPIIIDLAVTIAMIYIVFVHVQTLYPAVQGIVNAFVGKL
ncbi:MAG: hypothetical protein QW292_05105 [Candidatus Parvarchaeota archaeon]